MGNTGNLKQTVEYDWLTGDANIYNENGQKILTIKNDCCTGDKIIFDACNNIKGRIENNSCIGDQIIYNNSDERILKMIGVPEIKMFIMIMMSWLEELNMNFLQVIVFIMII